MDDDATTMIRIISKRIFCIFIMMYIQKLMYVKKIVVCYTRR